MKVKATNITNINQTVIIIPENTGTVLAPGDSAIIDDYNPDHVYLYKSYQRKGLKVETVKGDEAPKKIVEPKVIEPEKIVEKQKEIPVKVEETAAETEPEVLPEITPENVDEVKEATPKRKRSMKRTKNSDNSEDTSASTESGE